MSSIDRAEAARILGMKEREVYRVIDTDHGPVVVTFDGTESLILEDRIIAINRPKVPDVLRGLAAAPEPEPEPDAEELEIDELSVRHRAALAQAKRTEDAEVEAEEATATPEAKAAKKAPAKKKAATGGR